MKYLNSYLCNFFFLQYNLNKKHCGYTEWMSNFFENNSMEEKENAQKVKLLPMQLF